MKQALHVGIVGILLCCMLPMAQANVKPNMKPSIPQGYKAIARQYAIPAALFYAVALTESGVRVASNKFRPWPWTLNVEGTPYFYRTRQEAWRALTRFLRQGVTRIDIGLMQVNWYYHRDKLKDPWRALDPSFNVHVAARILREQYRNDGRWLEAAGRYHAPLDADRAVRYKMKVLERLVSIAEGRLR